MDMSTHQKTTYSKAYPPAIVKAMEAIVGTPSGPERWNKTAATWVNLNQMQESGLTAKEEYVACAEQAEQQRKASGAVYGEWASDAAGHTDSGVRGGIEIPSGLWIFLKMFDPDAFGTPIATRQNFGKLRDAFPEFALTEKY